MTKRRTWGTLLSLIATVIVLFAFCGITVLADDPEESGPEIVASGYCGAEGNEESVSWTLDSNGLLTISGTGEMGNYSIAPWIPNKDAIKKVVIGEGVTSIGNNAFRNCTSLASITIPDSVYKIGDSAFEGCSLLSAITIPDSVYFIGNNVFRNCTSLASITISVNAYDIGDSAFEGCSLLSAITIPDCVTSIGNNAFRNCTSLASITIPVNLHDIGDSAFEGCSLLSAITIPDSVTSIGNNAFINCTSLASITIPDSVYDIGDSAFEGCSLLSAITIPDRVTSIGNNVFRNCTSLASITIPDSVTSIGNNAFEGCSLLSAITIPDRVTSIGNNVFRNCTSLASITIPDSVTSIGNDAFRGCTSLTSITIPNSVTSIGDNAFRDCTSLISITIPDSVTSIGNDVFYGCTSLTLITIPNSVTSIGDNAFRDCTSLISITIPDSVTSIGDEAFRACTSLTSITIPDSVTSIGDYAFRGCTSLTSITIPDSVTSIGNDVFYGCTSLNKVQEKFVILGSGLHLYGYSLSLDGSIGVNFYMKLSDEVLNNDSTAFMRFTVNSKEQNVPVKDLTPNKDGYYIFRCDVVAKEMADEITAQVYIDENNPIGDAYTYSVREYAAYILDHPEKYSVNAIELVKAMLNYGAAAQKYFGYNTGDLANSILPADGQQTSLSVGDLEYYKDGEISPAKVSLSLKSTITLKLYFKTEDVANIKFEYKKQELKPTVSGEYTIVIIEGIPATNFSSKLSIKYYIGESTEAKTLKYRASNYACIVLKQENGGVITDELKEVLSALHIFSAAAIEYNSVLPA